jgi:AraC family transcriptional regulator
MATQTTKSRQGVYGDLIRDRYRLDAAPSLVSRTLRKSEIGISEGRADQPRYGLSDNFDVEDAYLVGVACTDYPEAESWEEGRFVAKADIRAGETILHDLKRQPQFLINRPFRALFFYVPRASFNEVADESDAKRISELSYSPGIGYSDNIVKYLALSVLPALDHPETVNRLFVDHIALALTAHVAQTYGGLRFIKRPPRGGLAQWQERRACEMLASHREQEPSLKEIAVECGLSVSHFSRAFRQSTGVSPHRWLLNHRIRRAKDQMKDRRLSLAEVAIDSGFAHQSHFTRAFTQHVGVSPGAWRRALEVGTNNDS